jgi:class II lanthipeptide synthase
MRRLPRDLRAIVQAVEIRSDTSFSISGERFDSPGDVERANDLAGRLANALYHRKYCRPSTGFSALTSPDPRVARVFVEHLSRANCGTGTWEPGWLVEAIADDGALIVRRRSDEFRLWARRDQFRPSGVAADVGTVGRIRIGKEFREMYPGYYAVLGDAGPADDSQNGPPATVRFYWHLTADGAVSWIRELSERFNAAGVAFHAKALSDPATYMRADAGVLYVDRRNIARAMDLLPDLHAAVGPQLRRTTPMFSKRLAPGLAVAEDPGDGRSFGQHRCQLVSEGLVRAFDAGTKELDGAATAIADRFAEDGLSILRPWLNAGSADVYHWS